jgi:CRISPR/Cas system CSM-associated protein Csm2 small subunit
MSDSINKYFLNKLNKQMKVLQLNNEKLKRMNSELENRIERENKLKLHMEMEKEKLLVQYDNFINFIINKGVSFEVSNKIFTLEQWESIEIQHKKRKILLVSKKGDIIKCIESTFYEVLNDIILRGYKVNFLVIRADERSALIQGMFNKIC